jgi:hypothetical protein
MKVNMTLFSLVLFIHVAAVLTLFAALSFEVLSLVHLRRASNLSEVQLWTDPVPRLPLMTAGSGLVVFISGVYLAMQMRAFELAWPKVAAAALLLIAPFGALTGKRLRAIRLACRDAEGINSQLLNRLRDPFLKISLGIRIAVFLGIVLLMAAQPELWESITIVGTSVVLGLLLSLPAGRRSGSLSAPRANVGD